MISGLALLVALCLVPGGASGTSVRDDLPGPVGAHVLRVVDGDTLEVLAHIWLGQDVRTRVRLSGIDAPELRGGCGYERDLAQRARAHLAAQLAATEGSAARIRLYDIRIDKYGGRILARVLTADGNDLGRGLVAAGLARPYAGSARKSWCAAAGQALHASP